MCSPTAARLSTMASPISQLTVEEFRRLPRIEDGTTNCGMEKSPL
jgi:hypothetical protein